MQGSGRRASNGDMTYAATAHTATTHTGVAPLRVAAIAAAVGGAAFVIDTVTITVVNSNFGVFDDVLFYTGLAALMVTLAALAVHLSRRTRGARRVIWGGLIFLVLFVGTAAFSFLMDAMGQRVFSEANVGLHGEWSFFSVGVALLVLAGWALRRR